MPLCMLCHRSSTQKALSLIQIEERAMTELEKAYCAADNPDEYIVVERCHSHQQLADQARLALPHNSPWAL